MYSPIIEATEIHIDMTTTLQREIIIRTQVKRDIKPIIIDE